MDEAVDSYLEHAALEKKLAESTIRAYQTDLDQASAWLCRNGGSGLSAAQTADIAEYIFFLASNGMSPAGVRRKLSTIRCFYRYLQTGDLREDNPAEQLHSPKKPEMLPHAVSVETARLLVEAWKGDTPLSIRNRALMELAYGAGLRESEITGMTVAAVHLEEAFVRPLGKGGKERIVPIGGPAVRWLSRYIDGVRLELAAGGNSPVLFLTYRGNPLSRMTVWNIVRRAAMIVGASGPVYPHTLRHSFATHLLHGGADLRVVQELLGHSDIRTTEIYTGIDRTYLRDIVNRCHPRAVCR